MNYEEVFAGVINGYRDKRMCSWWSGASQRRSSLPWGAILEYNLPSMSGLPQACLSRPAV